MAVVESVRIHVFPVSLLVVRRARGTPSLSVSATEARSPKKEPSYFWSTTLAGAACPPSMHRLIF